MRSIYILTYLLLIAALSWASPASAQFGFGGEGVVDVEAEEATYFGGTTILIGNVIVKQGDAEITADKMTIMRAETSNGSTALKLGEIIGITAEGNFSYTSPENSVTGNRGVYKRDKQQIDVFGNVVFMQPSGSFVESETLIYDLESKRARFKKSCNGDDCNGRLTFGISNQ